MSKIKINYIENNSGNNKVDDTKYMLEKTRPTAPHIQIYKWEYSMIYSILHRITAVGCLVISMLLSLTIIFAFSNAELLIFLITILKSPIMLVISFLVLMTVFYFIFADIKYMIWKTGKMMTISQSRLISHTTAILTLIATIGVMICYL